MSSSNDQDNAASGEGASASNAASGEGASARCSDGARSFDARLIPEFDGSQDIVEWFSRTEMLCELNSVPMVSVVPLRLSGGAFAVWTQLPVEKRASLNEVRSALYAAFALDQYAAYEAFCARRLKAGESADVYLADLRRLAMLFGGVSERTLTCAFIAGLPDAARQTIRAGSKAEGLSLADVLTRARAVLSDQRGVAAAAATRSQMPTLVQPTSKPITSRQRLTARQFSGEQEEQVDGAGARGTQNRRQRRCWICGILGHISVSCPHRGNGRGDGELALPSSPMQQ